MDVVSSGASQSASPEALFVEYLETVHCQSPAEQELTIFNLERQKRSAGIEVTPMLMGLRKIQAVEESFIDLGSKNLLTQADHFWRARVALHACGAYAVDQLVIGEWIPITSIPSLVNEVCASIRRIEFYQRSFGRLASEATKSVRDEAELLVRRTTPGAEMHERAEQVRAYLPRLVEWPALLRAVTHRSRRRPGFLY